MQTDKVRQEFSEDMSIQRAFSIVFDRRPDLKLVKLFMLDRIFFPLKISENCRYGC